MVATLNREGGDDRRIDIAFQKIVEQFNTEAAFAPEHAEGAGEIVVNNLPERSIPHVLGRISLFRSSIHRHQPR